MLTFEAVTKLNSCGFEKESEAFDKSKSNLKHYIPYQFASIQHSLMCHSKLNYQIMWMACILPSYDFFFKFYFPFRLKVQLSRQQKAT